MSSTALGAGAEKAQELIFISEAHEKFYYEKLKEVRYQDVYHKAFCYCLGISDDTRRNANRIYDFKTGCVKTECLHEGWQTSGSVKVVRMAFNLYCNSTPKMIQSVLCGIVIGFICGFVGAGGGMMMLLILVTVLGYELKTAVGTSVFIMAFTAFTGSISHFVIGGAPDLLVLIFCVISTLLWARIAARFANKASAITLNRATGAVLVILASVILAVNYLF